MTELTRRLLYSGVALAVALGLLWQFYPLPDASDRLGGISARGIGYESQPVDLRPEEAQILSKANVIRRIYRFQGQEFLLTVIDGTRDRHAVHDPLYCIRGEGWRVISQNAFALAGGEAKLIRISRDGHEAEALVWFSDGKRRYASPVRYWWSTTLRRLTFGRSSAEPVLVRLQTTHDNVVNWRRVADQFPPLARI